MKENKIVDLVETKYGFEIATEFCESAVVIQSIDGSVYLKDGPDGLTDMVFACTTVKYFSYEYLENDVERARIKLHFKDERIYTIGICDDTSKCNWWTSKVNNLIMRETNRKVMSAFLKQEVENTKTGKTVSEAVNEYGIFEAYNEQFDLTKYHMLIQAYSVCNSKPAEERIKLIEEKLGVKVIITTRIQEGRFFIFSGGALIEDGRKAEQKSIFERNLEEKMKSMFCGKHGALACRPENFDGIYREHFQKYEGVEGTQEALYKDYIDGIQKMREGMKK